MDTAAEDGSLDLGAVADMAPPPASADTEAPPAGTVATTTEPAPQAEAPAVPAPEPDMTDWRALAEKREKELDEERAHGSRLAVELGFSRRKLAEKAAPSDAANEDSNSSPHEERLAYLEERDAEHEREIQRLHAELDSRQRASMDAETYGRINQALEGVDKDLRARVIEHNSAKIKEYGQETNPVRRAELSDTLALQIDLQGNRLQAQRERERTRAAKEASTASAIAAKRAQSPSVSGASSVPPSAPKPIREMTASEADAWLRENIR